MEFLLGYAASICNVCATNKHRKMKTLNGFIWSLCSISHPKMLAVNGEAFIDFLSLQKLILSKNQRKMYRPEETHRNIVLRCILLNIT